MRVDGPGYRIVGHSRNPRAVRARRATFDEVGDERGWEGDRAVVRRGVKDNSELVDPAERFRTAIGVIQKQTVVLMVANGDHDRDLAIIACARVRLALRQAETIATAMAIARMPEASAATAVLHAARQTAAPWILRAPRIASIREAQVMLDRFGTRSLPDHDQHHNELCDVELDGVVLSRLDMSGAHLSGLRAREARLVDSIMRDARLEWCDFSTCAMSGIRLDASVIEDSSFERSNLERSSWQEVLSARSNFSGCVFVDANFDRAVFVECDFRGADLGIVNGTQPDGPVRAEFLQCDLRETHWGGRSIAGMRFADCRLHGTLGAPLNAHHADVLRPDLSMLGDGSQIGCLADVGWV